MAEANYHGIVRVNPAGLVGNVTVAVTRPNDTTQYAVNDALSSSTSAPAVATLSGVVSSNGGAGIVRGATLVKSGTATTDAALTVLLLRNTFTGLEDNAAVDLSDAEARTIIGGFSFAEADALALGANVVWCKTNLDIPFVCESTSDDLYVVFRWDDTYTPAAQERFDLTLLIER